MLSYTKLMHKINSTFAVPKLSRHSFMKIHVCAGDVPLQLHPLQQEQSYYSGCKACGNNVLEVSAHSAAVFVQQHG